MRRPPAPTLRQRRFWEFGSTMTTTEIAVAYTAVIAVRRSAGAATAASIAGSQPPKANASEKDVLAPWWRPCRAAHAAWPTERCHDRGRRRIAAEARSGRWPLRRPASPPRQCCSWRFHAVVRYDSRRSGNGRAILPPAMSMGHQASARSADRRRCQPRAATRGCSCRGGCCTRRQAAEREARGLSHLGVRVARCELERWPCFGRADLAESDGSLLAKIAHAVCQRLDKCR